jgi:hypothetical protein
MIYQHQITRRQFNTTLPTILALPADNTNKNKRRSDGSPSDNTQHNRDNNGNSPQNTQSGSRNSQTRQNNNRSSANTDVPSSKNPRINDAWRLPSGKQFHQCFYGEAKMSNIVPKYDDKPFCIRYFALGECKSGANCKYQHQDPRDVGLESQYDSFCKLAYS